MRYAALALLLSSPAAALVYSPSQTLEALQAQSVRDPAAQPRSEAAAGMSATSFDGGPFHIKTLTPVEHLPAAERRVETPVAETPAPPRAAAPAQEPPAAGPDDPQRSPTGNYYFEGKSPVSGITIYTAKPDLTGDGRTGSDGSSNPYAKYGKWGLIGGAALAVAAFVVGGPVGVGLGVLAGIALGAGALISFLFGKKR
jgi:hypothetical protein